MRRLLVFLLCTLIALTSSLIPAYAAGRPGSSGPSGWQQQDTAIYVVSTLNLLRSPSGELLVNRLNPTRFDVYADQARVDLFFVAIRGKTGSTVGAVAYEMGWVKPKGLSRSTGVLGIDRAPRDVKIAFHTDRKQIIGSFTSTLSGR